MAETTDLQRLIVSFEANLKGYERSLNKAMGLTNARTRQIEKRFNRMQALASTALARVGAALAGVFTVRGAQQLLDASTRITNALKVAGLQGEELTAVYDRLYQSAQNNAAPLESLVTLYGRAAIVQKELNVSSEELLRFTDNVAVALRVAGTDAQSASGALLQLSQALGSGTVRAEEFNSILEGALPIAQAAAAGLEEAGGSVAKLRSLVIEGKVSSSAFFRAFEAGSSTLQAKVAGVELTVGQSFTRLTNSLINLAGKVDQISGISSGASSAIEGLTRAIDAMAKASENSKSPIEQMLAPLSAVVDLWAKYAEVTGQLTGLDEFFKGPDPIIAAREELTKRLSVRTGSGALATGDVSGNRVGQAFGALAGSVSLKDHPVVGDGKKGRENTWQRETRQIQEATAALQVELGLIGQTEQARDKARAALELENAARRAGIELTPQHRAEIEKLSEAYAQAAEAARKGEEFEQFWNDAASAIAGFAGDAITDFKNIGDALDNLTKQLIDMVVQFAVVQPLKQGLSSLLGNALSGAAAGGGFQGFFAKGGVLGAGEWGIAGENGPEPVVGPARIIPNTALAGRGGGGSTVVQVIDQRRAGAPVETQRERGPDGREMIRMIVRDEVNSSIAQGKTDGSMRLRFGQTPRKIG